MDQSDGSPSMRGILSAGNWKILNSTPGRASAKPATESTNTRATALARMAISRVIFIDSASILRYPGHLRAWQKRYMSRFSKRPADFGQSTLQNVCFLAEV